MSELQETDFGNIPKSWNVLKIADLKANDKRAIAMGPFGSNIKAENFVTEGVPVIRGTNLNYSRYVDGSFVYLKEEKADELIGSNCKPGDLVFTHRGTIGQVGLIPHGKHARYVISQSGMKLSLNPDLMDSNFLLYFFKSEFGQYQILKYESQVGVPSISNPLTSLKEIQVPVPEIEEQKAIASVLSSLDDKIDLLHRQNTTLELMAETLFRQWFVEVVEDSWKEGTLEDIATFHNGKKRPDDVVGGKVPIYGGNGILGYTNEFNYEGPTIIIGRVGAYCGSLHIEYAPVWISDNALVAKPIKNSHSSFLFFLLKNISLNNMAEGSSHPLITQTLLKSIQILIPQTELIESFVSQVDNWLTKVNFNSNQIDTLEKLRDRLLPKLISGEVRITNE